MKIIGIIPARYNSTRFPGKPLALINNKTILERVYLQAKKSKYLHDVIIATDDERIKSIAESISATCLITSTHHLTGTDRCNEAINLFNQINQTYYDIIINIQGDHPFINPADIDLLAMSFENNNNIQISTLIKEIESAEELFNPNTVKVITFRDAEAIYFSRHPIPFLRDVNINQWIKKHKFYKHIGIYAFKTEILQKIVLLKPSKLELAESLEQLRWLENGFKIQTIITKNETYSVDTPEDLKKIMQKPYFIP